MVVGDDVTLVVIDEAATLASADADVHYSRVGRLIQSDQRVLLILEAAVAGQRRNGRRTDLTRILGTCGPGIGQLCT